MRTEADKMPESTISAIGNAPASLMTDLGLWQPHPILHVDQAFVGGRRMGDLNLRWGGCLSFYARVCGNCTTLADWLLRKIGSVPERTGSCRKEKAKT